MERQPAKTKSLGHIEKQMTEVEPESIRYRVLASAKSFKTSWIDLGQSLYSVWKEKLFKGWGYGTFEAYTAKEIGIKQATALKLLKSYYFLEKEEPSYLQKERSEEAVPSAVPHYEAVNMLRLAKEQKALDSQDYSRIKKDVLDEGKDPQAVRKDLTAIMKQREELDPEEARAKKRDSALKRLLSVLKSLKRDLEVTKLVSASVVKEIGELIQKIEQEL